MKFETVRIYLVKWRFWFVVWSKNFATVATWHKDFSSLLEKQQQQQPCTCAAHFFVHFFRLTLFCTTTMWNFLTHLCWKMSYVLTNVLSCSCSLFFLHCRSFSPCWPLFLIFSQPISLFFEICLLFLSNALALLSTSLKILKFSRTCLWARSIQPNFPEISVQNSMDRFGPTGKFRKNGSTFWGGPLFPVGPVGILVEWIAPLVVGFSLF